MRDEDINRVYDVVLARAWRGIGKFLLLYAAAVVIGISFLVFAMGH